MKVSVADLIEWEEGVTLSPAYRRRVMREFPIRLPRKLKKRCRALVRLQAAAGVPAWEQCRLPYMGRRW